MNKSTDLNKLLAKRLLSIIFLGGVSVLGLLKFGPKIGSLFGLISVNRNAVVKPPEANTPPPIFIDVPKAVNETKVDLKGISAPKTKIELFVNGPKVDTVLTDMSGEFLFTNIDLNKGTNTIFAKANETKSETINIEFDDEAPKIEIKSPQEGDVVENLNERIEIEGTVSEKAEIRINDRVAIQRPDNSFTFLLGVDEGEVKISIEAIDLAGNKTTKDFSVTYKRD